MLQVGGRGIEEEEEEEEEEEDLMYYLSYDCLDNVTI
jgi:hypothetical protein